MVQAGDIQQHEAEISNLIRRRRRLRRLAGQDNRHQPYCETYVAHIPPVESGYGVVVATQILAPSKENVPPILTVKLDCTTLLPGGSLLASTQGGVPAGTGGTMKFTWYRPTYPSVVPANI